MKHLAFNSTKITELAYYSNKYRTHLFAKRDDLFDEAGGGNKARMLQYILSEVSPENCDVIVTAGGPNSNFNRACALMCAQLGILMHLVEYTDEPIQFQTSLNYYMCNLASIRKSRCEKNVVAQMIQHVIEKYKMQGYKVKYIYGGGKSLEGIYAYYDAVKELKEQKVDIDHIFLACGTETTLTGICAGMQQFYPEAMVHAISTARAWEMEKDVLEKDADTIGSYLNLNVNFQNLEFSDNYLCGGYSQYNEELMDIIKECISHEGMIIDPTYSGKAFWGMTKELSKDSQRYKGKNICFLNTGGLFNLLSTINDR